MQPFLKYLPEYLDTSAEILRISLHPEHQKKRAQGPLFLTRGYHPSRDEARFLLSTPDDRAPTLSAGAGDRLFRRWRNVKIVLCAVKIQKQWAIFKPLHPEHQKKRAQGPLFFGAGDRGRTCTPKGVRS